MVSITVVYLIAGIGIVIGIAIGIVMVGLRQENPSLADDRSEDASGRDILLGIASTPGSETPGLIIDNVFFQSPNELGLSEKARLHEYLTEFGNWLKPETPPVWDSNLANMPPRESYERRSAPPSLETPATRPGLKAVDVISRALQPDTPKSASKPSSIAAQIDEILQEMIDGTYLEAKGIRLFENPVKGLVVMVGMTQYDSVEDVPDQEVRATIKAAVSEWERRMAPD